MKATTTKAAAKNFKAVVGKKVLGRNAAPKKTLAEALGAKRGRPTNAEIAARKAKEEKAAARIAAREAAKKAAAKAAKKETAAPKRAPKAEPKVAAKRTTNAAPAATNFKIAAFKKAISRALRVFNKDMTQAMEVLATYRENRKLLKDALPKHAVNAFEKSLAAKKDEKLLEKAMFAAEKHIVEKDFTM
jgi:hypothetical protein